MAQNNADLFLRISRWYTISIPLIFLIIFFVNYMASHGSDRAYFEALDTRWKGVPTSSFTCKSFGYISDTTIRTTGSFTPYQKQVHQDRVALMQYTLAPIIVWESQKERCLLVDVFDHTEQDVGTYAQKRGYRVDRNLGAGRYILIKND
jgi:hypothetical protein